jgi:glucose/arabinose dehydrogenase
VKPARSFSSAVSTFFDRLPHRSTIAAAAAVFVALLVPLPSTGQTLTDSQFAVDTVVSLPPFTPVGIRFAPDGRMFVWQKSGIVRIYKDGALLPTPFLDISDHVNNDHDRGMLGLALDPAFDANGYLYLSYVYEGGGNPNDTGPKTGRVTRVRADPANPDQMLSGSETVLLGTIATPPCSSSPAGSDCIGFDSDSHSAGTLRFATDGTLFISLGDGAGYTQADPLALRAQSLDSLNGKILRINPDGSAPPDNPFYDGTSSNRSKVYSYGLRNPFRFALEPTSGEPVMGDVGWSSFEEVDFGRGKNFGWPCYEGEVQRSEYAAISQLCEAMPASAVTFGAYTYDHAVGQTVIGGVVYDALIYPAAYQGRYFFADYSADWLYYGQLDASGVLQNVQLFGTSMGGLVDLELGPDGSLYYAAFNVGEVRRIRYTLAAPNAVASAKPASGLPPLFVQFSSVGSTSPDGTPLSYSWNFGDGTTSTAANPTHTYTTTGVVAYNPQLTVTTTSGARAEASTRVVVGSRPPTASITSPADGVVVHVGDTVSFTGTGSDPEDGILADTSFFWQVLLHHDNHVHVESTVSGRSGSFAVQDHGTGTFYYELVLTVTDSSGLAASASASTSIVTAAATWRINAGGPAYTDTLGQRWSADTGFNTGNAASTPDPIADPNGVLYQSERWDPPAAPELSYNLPVTNGSYRVNLYFAEIYPGAAFVGGRVFNVSIEGTLVLQNLDIFKEVGFQKPLVKSFVIPVNDGVLDIAFEHVVENPKISAIEVIPTTTPPPPPPTNALFRVNAGGVAFTDASGNAWTADANFNTGNTATSSTAWTGANPQLYSTERWDPPDAPELAYTFPVSPGTYTVNLHFAEIYSGTAFVGGRQFDVYINGSKRLDHLDIFAEVGFMAPLVKTFTVTTTGSPIVISFAHQIENPKISGIEILASSALPPPATATRVNAGGAAFTDASGNAWAADANYNTGNTATSSTAWTGANPQLYSTERWDPPDAPELAYSFPVSPGTYTVNLHFAEIYAGTAFVGGRQFDVFINGTKVLDHLDIFAEVGFMQPLVKTFTVTVTGSPIVISFVHEIENPKISGIEIIPEPTP